MSDESDEAYTTEAFALCDASVYMLRSVFDGRILAPVLVVQAMMLYSIMVDMKLTDWEAVDALVATAKAKAMEDKRTYKVSYIGGPEEPAGTLPPPDNMQ
jgi:hypothetical protein